MTNNLGWAQKKSVMHLLQKNLEIFTKEKLSDRARLRLNRVTPGQAQKKFFFSFTEPI